MLKEEQEGSVMAEYQRFVAYFYEYINGKKAGNAGFVRVDRRNGRYRLHLQLRREIWQPQPLAIYGYREQSRRNGEENREENKAENRAENGLNESRSKKEKADYYHVTYLGKGWPQGDSFIRKLEFQDEVEEKNKESLTGLWIPAGGGRCFISHWQEGEVEPERLKTPEELQREKEEQNRNKAKKTDIYRDYKEKDTEKKTESVEKEAGEKAKDAENREADSEKGIETGAKINIETDENTEKDEEKSEKKTAGSEEEGGLRATEAEIETEDVQANMEERKIEEVSEKKEEKMTGKEDAESGEEREALQETEQDTCTGDIDQENIQAKHINKNGQEDIDNINRIISIDIGDDREKEDQIRETRFGTGREPQECLEAMQRVKVEKETETESEWQQHWNMLRQHHRRFRPFEGVQEEGLMICPRDVMWLREQGWPVGRNSFMMQGFVQYHHLLLYDDGSRGFLLGVPGRDCCQERKQAADFGFPEFVPGYGRPGYGGTFGYWCRRL